MSQPDYQPFSKLRKIWSPADMKKLREHAAKFAALPAMAQPAGVAYPEFDGDMAGLDELADRIFTDLDTAFTEGGEFAITYSSIPGDGDHIYQALVAELNLTFLLPGFRTFPADHAAAMLAEWPAPIVETVVPA